MLPLDLGEVLSKHHMKTTRTRNPPMRIIQLGSLHVYVTRKAPTTNRLRPYKRGFENLGVLGSSVSTLSRAAVISFNLRGLLEIKQK